MNQQIHSAALNDYLEYIHVTAMNLLNICEHQKRISLFSKKE